ncbi:MAG: TRC40/GET3/ArsA family transport-energizing ATPase, partial [Armatimonadetes bacterium]|nr:TRC40/GET3/ArsA family transport-energizing ATPase [Armatimonadota bacterium]
MAAATAIAEARAGRRTLIVTTDPASNLADVFERPIGHRTTPLQGIDNLWAMEIDPDAAAEEYRARILTPLRGVMPDEVVRVVEEQLRSPCTAEIAAFDRFVDFMDARDFDLVIFDTAPTGHTLRLLALPVEWSRFIELSAQGSGQTCLGPVGVIQAAKVKYERAIALLRNPDVTRFVFVLQPEELSIFETRRALRELETLGVAGAELIVNGVLPEEVCDTPLFRRRHAMQRRYLEEIARGFPYPTRRVFLWDGEIKGTARLRALADQLESREDPSRYTVDGDASVAPALLATTLGRDMEGLSLFSPNGGPRAFFFAGKGGVGKTTVACATALHLASQGVRTLLATTDPAAHTGEVFAQRVEVAPAPLRGVPNLWAVRVDQAAAAARYKARILDEAEGRYSAEMIAGLREELESPCTEEIAVFDEFARYLEEDSYGAVIFDTAPTGHTLRLLQLPFDYRDQVEIMVARGQEGAARKVEMGTRYDGLIRRLRDPSQTVFGFVVYPEATPVVEAHRAMLDLAEIGISTQVVVVNYLLPEEACVNDYFRKRRAMQVGYVREIRERFQCPLLPLRLLDGEVQG